MLTPDPKPFGKIKHPSHATGPSHLSDMGPGCCQKTLPGRKGCNTESMAAHKRHLGNLKRVKVTRESSR
jgi:hypothetical protein